MKSLAILVSALLIASPAIAQQRSADRPDQKGISADEAKRDAKDSLLTGKVKSALAADVGLKTLTGINVETNAGIVTLKGRVDSEENKRLAEEVVKKVDGVKSVDNRLAVGGKKG